MRTLTNVTVLLVATTCVAVGCAGSSESVDAQSQSISNIPPPDDPPPPRCVPNCAGKACGAPDGCGHTCTRGTCPTGTVCGGGGTPNVCACVPSCGGKTCGAPDGCGGICTAGSCALGSSCGVGGVAGQCAPIPVGQGVECFVFDDGYTSMAGPSDAVFFSSTGQACVPNGSTGTCRKWFGRCRTTDSSHTPVTFEVGAVPLFQDTLSWSTTSDAIYSYHYSPDIFSADESKVCTPSDCRDYFGNASMAGLRPVHCRLFDDGYANMTALTNRMADIPNSHVWGEGLNGVTRKWFGRCQVGGCGDGVCDSGETHASCPADCKCGDGVCNNNETAGSCPADCGPRCGDATCNGVENCTSCPGDCGACRPLTTCSGAAAGMSAAIFNVAYEDAYGCAGVATEYANSQSEAETCVTQAGGTVVQNATASDRQFHTDPTYGCASITLHSYSDDSAARCAAAQGFTQTGPCP